MVVSECDVVLLIPPLKMKAQASPRKLLSAEEWSFRIWRGLEGNFMEGNDFIKTIGIWINQLAKKEWMSESVQSLQAWKSQETSSQASKLR